MEENSIYGTRDVVLAEIPFNDGVGAKYRPVIILEDQSTKFAICCCTSKDRTGKIAGKLIKKDSPENEVFFKFDLDTFISYTDIFVIYKEDIAVRIGYCDLETFNEILTHFEQSSFKASESS